MSKRLAIVIVFVVAGCQSDDPAVSDPSADRRPSNTVDPDDQEILDAALADLLRNPDLAPFRDFYGSGSKRLLYVEELFPAGYVPNVPGYQFEAKVKGVEVPDQAPKQLTVDVRWFRGRPMYPPEEDRWNSNEALRQHHKDWFGIEFCIYNGGGSGGGPIPIGGCHVYYDVKKKDGRWVVKYSGAMDP